METRGKRQGDKGKRTRRQGEEDKGKDMRREARLVQGAITGQVWHWRWT